MSELEMLGDIIARLERIEQRQIKTTALVEKVETEVEAVEKQEQQQHVGSFGDTDKGT